ncbi:hypothetical protein JG688_00017371 [Phytophthora aleatoria]|uniref:Uncharacterized protein n=1 Tax=Phytophthora aleatoria TaxID=2496075 RepID=A0A8J5ICK8_9STRA|nr:hypothetical protein JG688_00017371 [Phytophthora aleatoria]
MTETEDVGLSNDTGTQFDSDLCDARSTDSSPSSSSRSRKATNKKKENTKYRAWGTQRRRVYRHREKRERDSFQRQVPALTDQMARLTQRHIKKTNETNPVSSASTWKTLARYQQEEILFGTQISELEAN